MRPSTAPAVLLPPIILPDHAPAALRRSEVLLARIMPPPPPDQYIPVRIPVQQHWRCNICQTAFPSQDSLRLHHDVNGAGYRTPCLLCNHRMHSEQEMLHHLRVVHGSARVPRETPRAAERQMQVRPLPSSKARHKPKIRVQPKRNARRVLDAQVLEYLPETFAFPSTTTTTTT